MKNLLKVFGIIAMAAIIGFSMAACGEDPAEEETKGTTITSGLGEKPAEPVAVTEVKTREIDNNVTTLGVTGTTATSSNEKIATVDIVDGKVVVTSVAKGVATIYVEEDAHKSDAEIEIRVEADGTIAQGRIVKGGDAVIVISGTFAGATVGGSERPVRLGVKFEWDGPLVYLKPGEKDWSIKHLPLDQPTPLWFELVIQTAGDFDFFEGTQISYQYRHLQPVQDQDITNISLEAVAFPNLITLSGTAGATLKGTWNRDVKYTNVSVTNKNMTTEFFYWEYDEDDETDYQYMNDELDEGWTGVKTRVVDGAWSLQTPSSSDAADVSFSVQLESGQASDKWNYLGYWEMGQKNNLNPIIISNQDKPSINLGTIPFVMVSGNTSFTANSKRPFLYWIEFGYYWDEDSTVEPNGWAGCTRNFHEESETGNTWAVPMPANIKLNASILWRDTSGLQQRKGKGDVFFNTGNAPVTLNLRDISSVSYSSW